MEEEEWYLFLRDIWLWKSIAVMDLPGGGICICFSDRGRGYWVHVGEWFWISACGEV